MSDDDLVKRLRTWDHCWPADWLEGAVAEAAAAIERLTRERKMTLIQFEETVARLADDKAHFKARAEAADRKIAMAVEAFTKIANAPAWGAPDKWETTPSEVRRLARANLAALEKE